MYFCFKNAGLNWLKEKATRKSGIIRCLLTVLASAILLFALSFIEDGDALQAKDDTLGDEDSFYETWYEDIGIDISNRAGFYTIEEYSENSRPDMDDEKTYFEIKYSEPLMFRFYNKYPYEKDEELMDEVLKFAL